MRFLRHHKYGMLYVFRECTYCARKIRYVNVACSRQCSHVWKGRGEKGVSGGLGQGTENRAVDSDHGASKDGSWVLSLKSHHSE
jgi:hypothetical protein